MGSLRRRWDDAWRDALVHDARSIARYGRHAPRRYQRIWVDPVEVTDGYTPFPPDRSGMVIGGDWDCETEALEDNPIYAACLRHWRDGVAWEDVGAVDLQLRRIAEHGPRDGCRNRKDVVRRYKRLDLMFRQVRDEQRLRTVRETDAYRFRERGGVMIHVARDGRPVFGQRGVHRFVAARLAGLPAIPAMIGVVHPGALRHWKRRYTPPHAAATAAA